MAVEIFHYDSLPQDALTPGMKFLLTKWNALSAINKLTLQAITENASFNIADNSAYMIAAGGDFFFMHVGRDIQSAIGQDFTGRMLSTINDTVAQDLIDAYQQATAQAKPIFMRFTSSFAQNALVWERLVLPVPVSELGTILVCYSEVLSHQQEVFEYLFRSARNLWIISYPIFNAGELDDGWVLLMNEAARAAFSYNRPIANLRLRELSLFQFGELWGRLREGLARANPRATVRFDQLEMELIKMNRLVAFRFDRNITLIANEQNSAANPAPGRIS